MILGKLVGPAWFSGIASASTVGLFSEAPTYLKKAAPFYIQFFKLITNLIKFSMLRSDPPLPQLIRKDLFFSVFSILGLSFSIMLHNNDLFCVFTVADNISSKECIDTFFKRFWKRSVFDMLALIYLQIFAYVFWNYNLFRIIFRLSDHVKFNAMIRKWCLILAIHLINCNCFSYNWMNFSKTVNFEIFIIFYRIS